MSATTQPPSFILISPKQTEQQNGQSAQQPPMQFVSRRRLAFRPNSLKNIQSANPNKTEADSNTDNSTLQEVERIGPSASSAPQTQQPLNAANANSDADRARRILWTQQEQITFYEALKLHGKDFDQIARFMAKRKISKDKEQIRNYYLNAYKLWRSKAQIDESEWTNVSRDARELFILINGCEWRKRLDSSFGSTFDQQKFKALILDGVISFRPKRKKFLVTIRTPFCPALSKFFPYDKRTADIPAQIECKMKPLRNQDKEFVGTLCEQNPFLHFSINVNDKVATIFEFLERKWSANHCMNYQADPPRPSTRIRLFVDDDIQVHKIMVGIDEESSPFISLNRLKKDFDSKRVENFENSNNSSSGLPNSNTVNGETSGLKNTREIFDINEDKIRTGLTTENVGNSSVLQLFYLLGMNSQMVFNYEILQPITKMRPWDAFLTLANRDYDELMAKSATNSSINNVCINPPVVGNNNFGWTRTNDVAECQQGNTSQTTSIDNIVEEENVQFIKQIKSQAASLQKRPKRQIKLVHDRQKIFNGSLQSTSKYNPASLHRVVIQNGVIMNVDVDKPATAMHQSLDQIQPVQGLVQLSTSGITPHLSQNGIMNGNDFQSHAPYVETRNEFSLDSATTFSPFATMLSENSPNKASLPDDVRSAYEQMLKESSVDYCRKFEKLTKMHQLQEASPTKIQLP